MLLKTYSNQLLLKTIGAIAIVYVFYLLYYLLYFSDIDIAEYVNVPTTVYRGVWVIVVVTVSVAAILISLSIALLHRSRIRFCLVSRYCVMKHNARGAEMHFRG